MLIDSSQRGTPTCQLLKMREPDRWVLSVCLPVCLSVCLSVCLFICLFSVCLFSVCLFICLFICLFVFCLSVCLFSVCLFSVRLRLSVCLFSVCLFSVRLSVRLSFEESDCTDCTKTQSKTVPRCTIECVRLISFILYLIFTIILSEVY